MTLDMVISSCSNSLNSVQIMTSNPNLDLIRDEIRKTGYPLEYAVSVAFEKAGWVVISNKYYLDDVTELPREIDLLAYKMTKVNNLDVYTTVIVSCKKSERTWALLSRTPKLDNPNTDWKPVHWWSNDKVLNFEVSQPQRNKEYYATAFSNGVKCVLREPGTDIFAFQEMNPKKSFAPVNDEAIFSSVSSLLKAQSYEMSALPERKKTPSIYQFNLLSVLDGDLVRLDFAGTNIDAREVNQANYISRYMIKKKQVFSNVLFARKAELQKMIDDYGVLHAANCEFFKTLKENFFNSVVKDDPRRQVLIDDFRKELLPRMMWAIGDWTGKFRDKDIGLEWRERTGTLVINIDMLSANDEFILKLNESDKVKEIAAKALFKIYSYDGAFTFENEIPF